jgi:hypothetical protein
LHEVYALATLDCCFTTYDTPERKIVRTVQRDKRKGVMLGGIR